MTDDNEIPTYIGRAKCGCIQMAIVDDGTDLDEISKCVGDAIKRGLFIERVTVGFVREHGFEKCPQHRAEQLVLFNREAT